jgi:dodecin
MMTHISDVIELVGSSDKSWQDAAQVALEAKKTIHGITTVEIRDMTAKVDPNTGNIIESHRYQNSIWCRALSTIIIWRYIAANFNLAFRTQLLRQ